jgi:hypothetical protein
MPALAAGAADFRGRAAAALRAKGTGVRKDRGTYSTAATTTTPVLLATPVYYCNS